MTDGDRANPKISLKRRFSIRPKLCPKCLSPMQKETSIDGWIIPEKYLCLDCGYDGPVGFETIIDPD